MPEPETAADSIAKSIEAGREEYWSELPDCPKCDRARRIVKRLEDEVRELRIHMSHMEAHQHGANGAVLIPPYEADLLRPRRGDRGDDVTW